MSVCVAHGPHKTEVCVPCYSIQQERVERESAPLRYANTAPNLRKRVLAMQNGHSAVQPTAEEVGKQSKETE